MEYQQCNENENQNVIGIASLGKKDFHTEFCEFRELRIFENFKNSFSAVQGVVQIKPNSVLGISSVMRV